MFGDKGDEVRLGIALQMRQITPVESHLSSPTGPAGLRPAGQVRHLPLREHGWHPAF
jgi:hypothetical protein